MIIFSHLWQLARPRTLPLSVAVICCGNALAYHHGTWKMAIFLLSLATALALQVLSNMANDYGDGVRGTDAWRAKTSPARLTATGAIPLAQLRRSLWFMVGLCLLLGAGLLVVSFDDLRQMLWFVFLGILAIVAAVTYTIGRFPYAYYALGEVSVFCFFGLLGVMGSYYLQSRCYSVMLLLPAAGSGLLAAAVLHINNMRDLVSDKAAGKETIAGKLGFQRSKVWHLGLLVVALSGYLLYGLMTARMALLWLLLLGVVVGHGRRVWRASNPVVVGRELPVIVMIVFMVNLLFSGGLLWAG